LTIAWLLFCGVLLGGANVWVAARRSTIPLSLNGRLVEKEQRAEKHPGNDDVYLLYLIPSRRLQVDQPVFENLHEGDTIRKESWSRGLIRNGSEVTLTWSSDCIGLVKAMPMTLVVMLVTAFAVLAEPKQDKTGRKAVR